jgi:F0F1-type ATP synthase membrane subunit b/b'
MGASSPVQDFQASAARAQIPSIFNLAKIDINATNIQMQRDLNSIAGQIRTMGSTQRAQSGSSGFSVGSKSFLSIMSSTTDQLLRAGNDVRKDAELTRQKIWYQAQVQAQQLENNARLAEIRGAESRRQQNQSTIKSIFGGLSRLG